MKQLKTAYRIGFETAIDALSRRIGQLVSSPDVSDIHIAQANSLALAIEILKHDTDFEQSLLQSIHNPLPQVGGSK